MDNRVKLGCLARPQKRSELMLPSTHCSRISFENTFVSGIFQKDQRHSDLSIYMSTVMKSAKTEHIRASLRIARESKAVDCCET